MKAILFILTMLLAAPDVRAEEKLSPEAQAVLVETQGAETAAAIVASETKSNANVGPTKTDATVVAESSTAAPVIATDLKLDGGTSVVAAAATEAGKTALPENEIPLNLDAKPGSQSGAGAVAKVLFGFAVLAILAGGAWFLFRRVGKPGQRKNAPQIKILNQHHLGPKKSLAIIRVAGESILIGITDQNISLIKALSLMDEEIPEDTPSRFSQTMDNMALKNQTIEEGEHREPEDDFQIGGLNQLKDAVKGRLKNMRNLG